jgi:Uracil DNA glycosylase superfamily
MREESFRRSQEEGLRLTHIAPLNALVDDLRTEGRGWVPYLAPMYGGVEAEMLAILRDPGPMTDSSERGSGFLCLENDDPAAELYASLLDEAGIAPSRMVAWNAYPWYINRKPTSAELAIGVGPLKRLLDRLPRLRVVMLHGGDAQAMWLKFAASYPHMADAHAVLRTYHTSRQAFIGTKDVRDARMADLRETFAKAARILG